MKKIAIILLFISLAGVLSGCTTSTEGKAYYFDEAGNMSATKPKLKIAEKLAVYNFHSTARCYSCQTLGRLVADLMAEKYSQEINEGKIDYRQINVDLPENKEIAKKYQATGSSLYINQIINGQDNITQDTNVWRYISDEAQFKKYLGDKIDSSLGL